MKKVVRLTESDLVRIVKRVIKENESEMGFYPNLGKPKKFDVDGIECSLVNDELYFPNIDEVVKFPDEDLAKAAFSWCRLHAEDGISERQIHSKVLSKLKEMLK